MGVSIKNAPAKSNVKKRCKFYKKNGLRCRCKIYNKDYCHHHTTEELTEIFAKLSIENKPGNIEILSFLTSKMTI